jgi:hypothetical protein
VEQLPDVGQKYSVAQLAFTVSSVGEGKRYFAKASPIDLNKAFQADLEA